jgi:signal transduction histidine kinase
MIARPRPSGFPVTAEVFHLFPHDAMRQAQMCLAEDQLALRRTWRKRHASRLPLSARGIFALEQLLMPPPAAEDEHFRYVATRLAKLGIPMDQVLDAARDFRPLSLASLRPKFGPRAARAMQAWIEQRISLAVAEAYVGAQSKAAQALLSVLDAELNCAGMEELLQRVLEQAAQLFPFQNGQIFLLEERTGRRPAGLAHAAGIGAQREPSAELLASVLKGGAPVFVCDQEMQAQGWHSVWAVPLARHAGQSKTEPMGVLVLAFDRVYECLPQERDLLLALAERLTMAIERTRMATRLGRQQQRVLELSRKLLDAQDEERRRISRDLHDETGQALLALRLYLEMGLRQPTRAATRAWLRKSVSLVDTSVAELRRILAQLSPLLLDELGLEAALRVELRKLRAEQQWQTRFRCLTQGVDLERSLQSMIYRVVLEGLRNAARHAQARRVDLEIALRAGELRIRLSDDGRGMPPTPPANHHSRFGLSGMRERVRLAGGQLEVGTNGGRGVRLSIRVPIAMPQKTMEIQRAS